MKTVSIIICLLLLLTASVYAQDSVSVPDVPTAAQSETTFTGTPSVQPVKSEAPKSDIKPDPGKKAVEAEKSNQPQKVQPSITEEAKKEAVKKNSAKRYYSNRSIRKKADAKSAPSSLINKPSIPDLTIKENPAVDNPLPLPEAQSNRKDKIVGLYDEAKSDEKDDTSLSGKTIFSTFMALILVLGLAYVTILLIKWVTGQRGVVQSRSSGRLRVLESARLSQTGTIHIVSVKGKKLLIGSSTGQITLLQELEPDDESDAVEEPNNTFAGYLERYSKEDKGETPAARIATFLRDSSTQLREKYNSSRTGGKKS